MPERRRLVRRKYALYAGQLIRSCHRASPNQARPAHHHNRRRHQLSVRQYKDACGGRLHRRATTRPLRLGRNADISDAAVVRPGRKSDDRRQREGAEQSFRRAHRPGRRRATHVAYPRRSLRLRPRLCRQPFHRSGATRCAAEAGATCAERSKSAAGRCANGRAASAPRNAGPSPVTPGRIDRSAQRAPSGTREPFCMPPSRVSA